MNIAQFADIEADFLARVSEAVYATAATVDRKGRPRSRVLHPIWHGPTGWVISWPASQKAKHLAANPAMSLAYISNPPKPVYVDCTAVWVIEETEKQRIWELHKTTPPPLGFDPEPHYGSIHNPLFGLLRLTPWRIELADLGGEPRVWRAAGDYNYREETNT